MRAVSARAAVNHLTLVNTNAADVNPNVAEAIADASMIEGSVIRARSSEPSSLGVVLELVLASLSMNQKLAGRAKSEGSAKRRLD